MPKLGLSWEFSPGSGFLPAIAAEPGGVHPQSSSSGPQHSGAPEHIPAWSLLVLLHGCLLGIATGALAMDLCAPAWLMACGILAAVVGLVLWGFELPAGHPNRI